MDNTVAVSTEKTRSQKPGYRHALMHLLMLIATLCWAGNMIAVKEALRDFGPLALTQLRVAGAAGILGIVFLLWNHRPALPRAPRVWVLFALLALFGTTLNQLFFIGGLARTSVAHTGLIVALGPVMVLALSCLMHLENLTVLKLTGMLISFVGVAILTLGKAGQSNGGNWKGDLIILLSSAVFAFYTILVKKVADVYDALTLNALTYGLGALFMLPFGSRATLEVKWSAVSWVGWVGALYIIVLGSVVAYLIYAFALTELTASRVAAFSYLQPVTATALAIWLLAEKLTRGIIVGGSLILLGLYLAERERGERES